MLEITNLTPSKIDKKFLIKAADVASAALNLDEEISLVFVCDARMKTINKKYRGKNATTDVLSFEDLNEIYICLPQAKRQAKLLKTSEKAELTRLLVHGIVHLKGHDHEKSAKEAEKMRQIEEGILKNLER